MYIDVYNVSSVHTRDFYYDPAWIGGYAKQSSIKLYEVNRLQK